MEIKLQLILITSLIVSDFSGLRSRVLRSRVVTDFTVRVPSEQGANFIPASPPPSLQDKLDRFRRFFVFSTFLFFFVAFLFPFVFFSFIFFFGFVFFFLLPNDYAK